MPGENLSYLEKLAGDLIKSKQTNYSEDSLNSWIDSGKYFFQQMHNVTNYHGHILKCTLITHKNNKISPSANCIVFLHGLGGCRLQARFLLPTLPQSYCLCTFDMSASGKSQGDHVTYGMREKDDIKYVLKILMKTKQIKRFVLWGRSMGAVAALLFASELESCKQNHHRNHHMRNNTSKQLNEEIRECVKCLVIDSPFHNFKDIACDIASKHISIPQFLLDFVLHFICKAFDKILSNSKNSLNYNPFLINLGCDMKAKVPAIFLYSQTDEVVPCTHSERIIQNYLGKYEKIIMQDTTHNSSRSDSILKEIYKKIDKFILRSYDSKKQSSTLNHNSEGKHISSQTKKRGISIFHVPKVPTSSSSSSNCKQAKNQHKINALARFKSLENTLNHTVEHYQDVCSELRESLVPQHKDRSGIHCIPRKQKGLGSTLRASLKSKDCVKKNAINMSLDSKSPRSRKGQNKGNISVQLGRLPAEIESKQDVKPIGDFRFETIDFDLQNSIQSKLGTPKTFQASRIMRARRHNEDRKKQLKLTHQEYLK